MSEFKRDFDKKVWRVKLNTKKDDKCFVSEVDENGGVWTNEFGRLYTFTEANSIIHHASGLMVDFIEMELVKTVNGA